MKCCVAFEALLLLLVTQAASAIYHACNPSKSEFVDHNNVLAYYDGHKKYYQATITSVSGNMISVTYLDEWKETLTADKVKIVTSTKKISPQTIEDICNQNIYCVEALMWGRAQSTTNCQAPKLKWKGDDKKKTKRDCSQIEIIETEVSCDTANAPDTTTSIAGKQTTTKADSGEQTTTKADSDKQTTSTADAGGVGDAVDATDGDDDARPVSGAAVAIVVIIVLIVLGGAGFAVYWFLIRKGRVATRVPAKDLEMGDQPKNGSNAEAKHSDSEDSTIDESDDEQSAAALSKPELPSQPKPELPSQPKPELPSQPKPPVPDLSKNSSMNDYKNDYNPKGLPQRASSNDYSSDREVPQAAPEKDDYDNDDYNSKGPPQPAPESDDDSDDS